MKTEQSTPKFHAIFPRGTWSLGKMIALVSVACTLMPASVFAWGWAVRDTARQTSENPTIYLGDSIEFQWDVNADGWGATYKKAGAGTVDSSAGMNWQDLTWVDDAGDGGGGNEGVKSASFQGTSVATWYYSLWLGWGASVGDNGHWYTGSSTWNDGAPSFASSSFTVTALNAPSGSSAVQDGTSPYSQINLDWTRGTSGTAKDTIILRKKSMIMTAPSQGTSYNVNDTIDGATVIYKGSGTSFNDTGLDAGTSYNYAFYAENYSYYSGGEAASASTKQMVKLNVVNVNVREAGEGRFFVKLDSAPGANVTVTVARISGDASLVVGSGETLTFTPANWNTSQGVVLTQAADDGNTANETATFTVSAAGVGDQNVMATALDDDGIGENMALASSGSTITGTAGTSYAPACLIDGLHVGAASGYTVWTNLLAPGSMTLDLLATATVSRVRMLNYPVSERPQQFKVEYLDGLGTWQPLVDASTGEHRGWEDWGIANVPARYLKFTGLNNTGYKFVRMAEWEVWGTRSVATLPQLEVSSLALGVREGGEGRFYVRLKTQPQTNVVVNVIRSAGDSGITVLSGATMTFSPANYSSWRRVTLQAAVDGNSVNEDAMFTVSMPWFSTNVGARALDGEIGENLARTGGSTITGTAGSFGRPKMIDGIHTDPANYGYTVSTNVPAATITLDLKANATLTRIRLLNFDWIKQENGYKIEGSTNNVDWTTLADTGSTSQHGWDDWDVSGHTARYLRFTGTGNSLGSLVRIAELEVYGTRPGGRRSAETTLAKAAGTLAQESEPISVLTSDGVEDGTGWAAVDGDSATAWVGQKAGGGHLLVEYAPALKLKTLEVDLAKDSLAGIQYLYSPDAKNWKPLPDDMECNPVLLNFLWLVFPDDGTAAVPKVIEIRPNP